LREAGYVATSPGLHETNWVELTRHGQHQRTGHVGILLTIVAGAQHRSTACVRRDATDASGVVFGEEDVK
jgi:hypothetical protein